MSKFISCINKNLTSSVLVVILHLKFSNHIDHRFFHRPRVHQNYITSIADFVLFSIKTAKDKIYVIITVRWIRRIRIRWHRWVDETRNNSQNHHSHVMCHACQGVTILGINDFGIYELTILGNFPWWKGNFSSFGKKLQRWRNQHFSDMESRN